MWKRKRWVPLAVLAFLLQLLLEAYAALHIQKLNMLPERYLYLAYGVLAGVAVLNFFLLFWGTDRERGAGYAGSSRSFWPSVWAQARCMWLM